MKTENNEQNKKGETTNFLMILDNIKRCKGLDWKEKALLSNYISFLRDGKEFFQTDEFQAKELGLSPAQISKFTGKLKERGEIETEIKYDENPNGERPIPKRFVTVLDIGKWSKGDKTPVVNKVLSPAKKKLAKKMAETNKAHNIGAVQQEEKASTPNNISGTTIVTETTQVDLKNPEARSPIIAEQKENAAKINKRNPVKDNPETPTNNSEALNLNFQENISTDKMINEVFIKHWIKGDKSAEFFPVNVKQKNGEIISGHAAKIPAAKKYFLKSVLEELDPTISIKV
jgi:hypothetical protein